MGDRVRLRPRQGGDMFDMALAARSPPSSASSRITKASSILRGARDDPGRDMGMLRQPGHRFFFDAGGGGAAAAEEARPESTQPPHPGCRHRKYFPGRRRIRRRSGEAPGHARASRRRAGEDFGIRGFDLAYAFRMDTRRPSWWMPTRTGRRRERFRDRARPEQTGRTASRASWRRTA